MKRENDRGRAAWRRIAALALLAVAGWAAAPQVAAAATSQPEARAGLQRGARAIDRLGARLPQVARAYGLSAADLEHRLRADRSLAVDADGRLLYTCAAATAKQAGAAGEAVAESTAPLPLADTFTLHSLPGAARTLYLDFTGDTLVGSAWNEYTHTQILVCPPWDTDGDPATFGDDERAAIQHVWQRVAEDYAPFAIDVTTQEPSSDVLARSSVDDASYGARVLITPLAVQFGEYGGIAYMGVFDRVDPQATYMPALVFPEQLGDLEKNIAEVAAHEVGHTLGLAHDGVAGGSAYYSGHGDGETGWAPIMGAGYDKNLTQWSKGEYLHADNTEDDLALMQAHGLALRHDDHGNTRSTATVLPEGSVLAVEGVIGDAADVDAFRLTASAGQASFSVRPAERGPDLDTRLEVLSGDGRLLAVSEPSQTLDASLSLVLPAAGVYFVRVQGVGSGDPLVTGYTDYGSLGRYVLSASVVDPSGEALLPVAQAIAEPSSGVAPLTVVYDGSSSSDLAGNIVRYAWDFGDGEVAEGVAATHTYSAPGSYHATLAVVDDAGRTAVTSITVRALQASIVSLSARSPSAYAAAKITGTLKTPEGAPLGACQVLIQSSRDGLRWKATATVATADDGSYVTVAAPKRLTYYRAVFAGAGDLAPATSTARTVKPRVRMSTPSSPARVAVKQRFRVTGTLEPRHTPGTKPVVVRCYRRQNGTWKLRRSVAAKVSEAGGGVSRYSATLSLPASGSWRLRAYHAADASNAATMSSARSLTVR
ncbi:MAG: PKD domain-containing protein [Thermoleophilia bacterium]